jgi:hypothetical protein
MMVELSKAMCAHPASAASHLSLGACLAARSHRESWAISERNPMATQSTTYLPNPPICRLSWSGIFSGTFLFLAIEATFGILGVAIFTQAMSPNTATAVSPGVSIGSGIWMVVLSIIALYFAGKLASRVSGSITRNAGMYAGLVTFGMCVFASFLITSLTLGNNFRLQANMASASGAAVADFIIVGGYWLFAALVLGMIAAASGGLHGSISANSASRNQEAVVETRRAA